MQNDRISQIALIVAKRKILDMKIPSPSTPAFEKWVKEQSLEFDLTLEEFTEFVQFILQEATKELTIALQRFKTSKKQFGFVIDTK